MSGADGGSGVCVYLGQKGELRGRWGQAVAGKPGGRGITWPGKYGTLG